MANLKFLFKGKNYSIDESVVASASAELESHLQDDMSGSGAVINFRGTSYNVDAEKLATERSEFISYLGTISGTGSNIIVNGTGYSVDSTKLNVTSSELATTFDQLSSGEVEPEEPVVMRAAGLYETGTDTLKTPWEDLVTNGIANVENGVATFSDSSNVLAGDLVFPSDGSVNSVGRYAFLGCKSLTSVVISENITSIDSAAFYECLQLTSVEISDSVTSVDASAFYGCSSLSSITVSEENKNYSSLNGNLYNKNQTTLIKYAIGKQDTAFIIPSSVTSIGDYAFQNCSSLTSIEIPNSVTLIGCGAFESCSSLDSIVIPDRVTSIGDTAFSGCNKITSITIGSGVTSIGVATFNNCNALQDVYYKGTLVQWQSISIGSNNASLNNATIHCDEPDTPSVRAAGLYQTGTDTMVTSWDDLVVDGTIHVDNGVVYTNMDIDTWVNSSSDALVGDLVLPNDGSVNSIGDAMYDEDWNCIGRHGFCACQNLTGITIPDSITVLSSEAFCDCSALTSIVIPDSVVFLGDYTFYGCSALISIVIGDGITSSIQNDEFADFSNLTSVVIGDGVTSIGDFAFKSCSNLRNIIIGNSVTTIGQNAFLRCESLTKIYIPDSVTSIGSYAFERCYGITDVIFGTGITLIDKNAFSLCNSLQNVYYKGTEEQWKAIVINSGNNKLDTATIHYNYEG